MSDSGISRPGFIGKLGHGLLAANVAGVLLKDASSSTTTSCFECFDSANIPLIPMTEGIKERP